MFLRIMVSLTVTYLIVELNTSLSSLSSPYEWPLVVDEAMLLITEGKQYFSAESHDVLIGDGDFKSTFFVRLHRTNNHLLRAELETLNSVFVQHNPDQRPESRTVSFLICSYFIRRARIRSKKTFG